MAIKTVLLLYLISRLLVTSYGVVRNSNFNSPQNIENLNCIRLSDCPEFLWLLQNRHHVPGTSGFQEVLQYLQSQQCGFDGNDPKVKCPMTEDAIEDEDEIMLRNSPLMMQQDIQRVGGVIDTPSVPVRS